METERLGVWLAEHIGTDPDAPLHTEVISGGASNFTLAVDVGDRRVVVRRPPLGHFLPTAHDMTREYRVYRALHGTPVPVPKALGYCDDENLIGAPFYVMEYLDGVVPHEAGVLHDASAATNARCGDTFVDVLAAIHAVDVDEVGLGGFAKRDGYLARQVARWSDQWERSKGVESPAIDELGRRLRAAVPSTHDTTLVHGDYRLGNVMLDRSDTARFLAVLDWEMATLGDPLSDLGYTLLYWSSAGAPVGHPSQAVADLPGFRAPDAIVERYARQSGRACDALDFYVALAAFKLAVIGEGQRARHRRLGEDTAAPSADQPLAVWALDRFRN